MRRFIYFFYFLGEGYKGRGQIWKNWEMSGIEPHDIKFPKNKKKDILLWDNGLVPCHLCYFNKILIGKKYRQGDENRRILERGMVQSAVVTQTQRKQDENASLIKGTKPCD